MKGSFIVEGGSGPGNRRSGSLPSLARDPWATAKFESRGGAQSASLGGPERCPRSLSACIARLWWRAGRGMQKNNDNLMKISKNMAKLVKRSLFID